ncbi:MAG: hypothetical protein E7442_03175 [Ruminococcaceae bacterium]|nr:hypothetical protein [Oscillospiraceae bacterium]
MGASQYKKKRVEDREAGVITPAEAAAQEKARKDKKSRKIAVAVAALVVVMIALVVFVNSSLFSNGLAAVNIGGVDYTVAETRYAYELAYQQFYNNNSSFISYFLDPNKPLDEQECSLDPSMTWKDYFMNEGIEFLRTITAIYNEAQAAGYTLSEDGKAAIDAEIEMLAFYGNLYGYGLDSYIAANYGDGVDEELLRSMLERVQIANEYANVQINSYEYSVEELDAHYEENADQYNTAKYMSVFLSAAADEEAGITEEEAREEAQAIAEAIKADCDGTVDSFKAAALKHAEKEVNELTTAVASTGDNQDWFTDPNRMEGDTHIVDGSSGVTVYFFEGIDTHDYNTVDVRHLLIMALDSDGSGDFSDEEKNIAKEQLETIMKDWDGTEEGFIALVEEYSQDTGSNTNGGLYQRIYKGQMVGEFDSFCFSGAKPGDTATVYGESDAYSGYHFIYFVGENMPYNRVIADNALRSEAYSAWEAEKLEPITVEKTFMFRYV